jgi:hypothetical protein
MAYLTTVPVAQSIQQGMVMQVGLALTLCSVRISAGKAWVWKVCFRGFTQSLQTQL